MSQVLATALLSHGLSLTQPTTMYYLSRKPPWGAANAPLNPFFFLHTMRSRTRPLTQVSG